MSDRKKLMALRDASVDARRKAALGLDMGDPPEKKTSRTRVKGRKAAGATTANDTRPAQGYDCRSTRKIGHSKIE
jgi:hypothetical protein